MKVIAPVLIAVAGLLFGVVVLSLILRPKPTPARAPMATAPIEQLSESPAGAVPVEPPRETPAAPQPTKPPPDTSTAAQPAGSLTETTIRALSLRRLEARLTDCRRRSDCSEKASYLDDLTIIDGYLTDPRDRDIILLGRSAPDRPPLHVEDFAVALRSAWGKYDERRGNTIYTSDPGCSIDPDPTVIRELEGLAGRISTSDTDGGLEAWNRICHKPQKVRVMGVPFHSRFARIMVEADYDMKSQVDGSDPLEISGLVSLTDMTLAQVRRQVKAGKSRGFALSSMNRFWFNPGDNLFEEASGMVLIRRSPVTLLTHQTFVNAGGKIADAAARDPLAELFAANFTRLFDQVAKRRPIFRELEGLFRFVAVARILEGKLRTSPFAGTLAYLLENLPIEPTRVDESKPGRANFKGFDTEVSGGRLSLRLPSCGGVAMPIDVGASRFRDSATQTLPGVHATALRGKDATPKASWTPQGVSGGAVDDLFHSLRASGLGGFIPENAVFLYLRDNLRGAQPTHFALYAGLNDPLFKGSDFDQLLDAMEAHAQSRPIILFRDLSSPSRDAGFDSTLAIRRATRRDLNITLVEELGKAAVQPGETTVDQVGTIERVKQGAMKGLYAVKVYVTHALKQFVITIYGHSPEAVKAAVRALTARLAATFPEASLPLSLQVALAIHESGKGIAAHLEEIVKPQTANQPPRSMRLT